MKGNIRMRKYVEKYSIFLLVVMCFLVIGSSAYAQEEGGEVVDDAIPDGGIQLSPTKFVWTLDEGETKTGWIVVKNYSDAQQNVTVEVEDFYVKEDGTTPQLYTPDEEHDLKALDVIDWVSVPDPFTLEPGAASKVEFTVRVPDSQPTNGYYGSLLFRTGGADSDEDGSKIGLSYRIGTLLIMAVQGDEPMTVEGEIQKFYPERKLFFESPTVLFAQVQNTGNIHYPIFGEIELNRFGKKFHVIEMTPRLLYPIDTPTTYREIMEFDIWDFGKYTAKLSMHTEDNRIQKEMHTSFWVIPWQLIVMAVIALILFIILWKLFKRYVHIGRKPQKSRTKKK